MPVNIHTGAQTEEIYFFPSSFVKNTFLFQSEQKKTKQNMHLVIKLTYILKIFSKRNTQAPNNYEHIAFAFK